MTVCQVYLFDEAIRLERPLVASILGVCASFVSWRQPRGISVNSRVPGFLSSVCLFVTSSTTGTFIDLAVNLLKSS